MNFEWTVKLVDNEMVQKLKHVLNPSLQIWCHKVPEKNHGVIYVGVNVVNGKMYVGLHGSGNGTKSVYLARICNHVIGGTGGSRLVSRAASKYGKNNIKWYILEYVDESVLKEREQHWISSSGLDTIVPKGYNLTSGGERPKFTPMSCQKMTNNMFERWSGMNDYEISNWAQKRRDTIEIRRQEQLLVASDEEKSLLEKKFSKQDKNRLYQKNVKYGLITPSSELRYARSSAAYENKRRAELEKCKTEEERFEVEKRQKRQAQNREYKAQVRAGNIVPQAGTVANKKRAESHRATIEKRRKLQLDAARTDCEYKNLIKKFEANDRKCLRRSRIANM